jgi:hypothetical protein
MRGRFGRCSQVTKYEEFANLLGRSESPRYFNVILAAAFAVAIHRHFAQGYTVPDVIQFVADERTRHDDFKPRVAEQLVLSVLTGQPAVSLDDEAKANAQIALLLGLIEDADLDDPELDAFVEEARTVADGAMPQFEHLLRGHSRLRAVS